MASRETLWEVFVAGFASSAEGFNGEIVGSAHRYPDDLRESFELWLTDQEVLTYDKRPKPLVVPPLGAIDA
mgnify:CR=1 FL=1